MAELSPETREILEYAAVTRKPELGVQFALGRITGEMCREMLGMPPAPANPRAAAGYAPSDDSHILCPTCGGAGEIVAPDDDDSQQDAAAASQPAGISAAAMPGWARAFAGVHAADNPARR